MSVDSPTRRQPVPPPPPPSRGGFSLLTLLIAAVAAVVAALVVSHFWQSGTLWATAMTPVVVALVKETLERPAQKVRTATIVPRHPGPGEELIVEDVEPGPFPSAPLEPAGYKTYGIRRKHWRLALVTGLAAAVLGALILTVPELVAGRSITQGKSRSTLFGGKSHAARKKSQATTATQTVTTTVPSQTQTTTTPAQTSTTPTTTTTTPAQTTTTPAPQNTTTSPPPGQTTPTVPTP
jgi:uncharacterized membrane protein YvlD (DUF360 family)